MRIPCRLQLLCMGHVERLQLEFGPVHPLPADRGAGKPRRGAVSWAIERDEGLCHGRRAAELPVVRVGLLGQARALYLGHEMPRCSVSCGDGRHERPGLERAGVALARMRRVTRKSDPGGIPCWGSSLENGECNNGPCEKTNCRLGARAFQDSHRLGPWSSWSECEAVNTQRYRRRSVEVAPSYGGEPCDLHLIMPGTRLVIVDLPQDRSVLRVGRLFAGA